jgi:o-succinylbenzoate---CoA ligase
MDPARRITLVSLVPTMLARLLDAGLARPPTLRWVLLGGGPIPGSLLARAQAAGVPVAPTYGMTETCSQIATFGWPLAGAEITVEHGGEVLARGPMVSAGALGEDGWLHTGDLGRFDERGRLEITGRKADTIVTGGENVAPVEVEDVLMEHPDVLDAAVFARTDPEWGEAVVAQVVLREGAAGPGGANGLADELRAFCGARLAGFKVPKEFTVVGSVPRSPTGKLLRRELGGRRELRDRPDLGDRPEH